jgi:hypothetical protein
MSDIIILLQALHFINGMDGIVICLQQFECSVHSQTERVMLELVISWPAWQWSLQAKQNFPAHSLHV